MNNWLTWSLLSALFAGATAILAKIGVTGVDSNFATAIRTTVILLLPGRLLHSADHSGPSGTSHHEHGSFSCCLVSRPAFRGSAIFAPCN
jgi:uncharacterized membrane protein